MKLLISQILAAPGMERHVSQAVSLKLSLLEWRGDGSTTVDHSPPTIGMDLDNWIMGQVGRRANLLHTELTLPAAIDRDTT